ncbi:uncharacterized protein LOC116206340 [Punica granatum]|uniref:Uncharacterized protein LOC116206340 n=1 Tax=Punica granatum TaxID=22663 RepID=A0A218X567_PUNGR|nr:uncharacterized protein LOC116206340 [Punica granatum]XP_031395041.1 uncharacterized protein LOC116206340 [Punica granatum]XP_031395042.1 uncharacterized protein LOC116206340 [Punica granatum]OWM79800.1 hypothetical protein CDL15_Pgr023212 [Punica granatum]
MSFLAGRLAGKEAAHFFQESKHAVTRLAEKKPRPAASEPPSAGPPPDSAADVLPEVLRHSLPSKLYYQPSDPSSFSTASKWALESDPRLRSGVSPDALNPLRAYLTLPQVSFGPKRWQLPEVQGKVLASTANELRQDRHVTINPEKLKAAAEGLANIGKAFIVATVLIFGGASLVFGVAASKLDVHKGDDIGAKVRDRIHPKFETIKEQVDPLRGWVENMSKKWKLKRENEIKQKPIIKELSKVLGVKTE